MSRNKRRHMGPCCACVFWEVVVDRGKNGYQDEGLCRRHPPVAIPSTLVSESGQDADGEQGMLAAWPRTFSESDWCGDFRCDPSSMIGRDRETEDEPETTERG